MQRKSSLSRASDLRQSVEYGKYMESLSWLVKDGVFLKKIPLIPFYFAKYQRPRWPLDVKKFIKLLKNNRVILAVVEPDLSFKIDDMDEFKKFGFKKNTPMLPSRTIWLDLNKSESELLGEMHAKTRYNIKKYRARVEVVPGNKLSDGQFNHFYSIYKKNAKKQKFWGTGENELKNLIRCFSKKAYLLLANEGGLLLLIHNGVAYYSHNASSVIGKKKFVPTTLTWEAI
ncbi:aminoacyltransferase, partial [Patescibacteria group bacterium]|nr:aminoacyltransferase [Patescibacteria group bacterium]